MLPLTYRTALTEDPPTVLQLTLTVRASPWKRSMIGMARLFCPVYPLMEVYEDEIW